jgi:hypothetical protein
MANFVWNILAPERTKDSDIQMLKLLHSMGLLRNTIMAMLSPFIVVIILLLLLLLFAVVSIFTLCSQSCLPFITR